MAKITQLQLRRDLNASVPTLAEGELFVSTDTFKVTLGSVANGNMPLVTASKKYKALWLQEGGVQCTVVRTFEDTIGGSWVGASSALGAMRITNTAKFTLNKTLVRVSNGYDEANNIAVAVGLSYPAINVNYFDCSLVPDLGDGIYILIEVEIFF